MFYWLVAIPFFVAFLMMSILQTPSNDLKKFENISADSTAFRMAYQHDAAVRFLAAKVATPEEINSGYVITSEDIIPYLSSNYVSDFDSVRSYIVCSADNCRTAERASVVTMLIGNAGFVFTETARANDFRNALGKYSGSFPLNRKAGETYSYSNTIDNVNITYLGQIGYVEGEEDLYLKRSRHSHLKLTEEFVTWKQDGETCFVRGRSPHSNHWRNSFYW